jgi:primosomal protein N' (replication factor Y)
MNANSFLQNPVPKVVVLRVAVDAPVMGIFDYVVDGTEPIDAAASVEWAGRRVRVPFGRSERVGVVLGCAVGEPAANLKSVLAFLDAEPLLTAHDLRLGKWMAGYYHAPLGEVLGLLLPTSLRAGAVFERPAPQGWRVLEGAPLMVARSARQTEVLQRLRALSPHAIADTDLRGLSAVLRALEQRGWVERVAMERDVSITDEPVSITPSAFVLNAEQAIAHEAIAASLGTFGVFVLHGITGSGKTEVYLAAMVEALQRGLQVLVLVPEIALTPQWVARFVTRFAAADVVVLHSGLTARAREKAWAAAQSGRAKVVLGTRSAVLTPMPHLGLLVIDEEHDPSYKQQEGLRYQARDVALVRAQQRGIPVVLGSATPSLESLAKVAQGRYACLRLTRRAGGARLPRVDVLDMRRRAVQDGLSAPLLERIRVHLLAGGQVLLFLNRRGFAPALVCHDCGEVAQCLQCSAPMTVHRARGRLVCHHCGAERAVPRACSACGSTNLDMPGQGTERLEMALRGLFPEFALERIDRDTTRRKGELEAKLARAHSGEARILLGTQMLSKGHDFPGVTLAAVLDADSGLMSSDFRAPERLVQLIVQVAGRAGRAQREADAEVVIQTHQPEHPLLQALLHGGFDRCADILMRERKLAELPPFAHLALLRAEAKDGARVLVFLQRCALFLRGFNADLRVMGPAPAPLEMRAGRMRFQLLLMSVQRVTLHEALRQMSVDLPSWPERRGVLWSLDVDPQDMD